MNRHVSKRTSRKNCIPHLCGDEPTGVEEKSMQQTQGPVGSEDYRVYVSGGARKELRIRIESVGSDPLTLLAMTYNVEVN